MNLVLQKAIRVEKYKKREQQQQLHQAKLYKDQAFIITQRDIIKKV